MTDKSRSRLAEEALRRSEAQYRQIVEATSDGIVQADARDVVVFVNRRLAEMLGYEPAEMIGRSLFDFMSPEARAIAAVSMSNRRSEARRTVDITYRHRDGTDISVNVAGSALLDAEGNFVGNMGMVRDVTERKKLQSQLMVSDRMASIGTLAAGVAHEINNPLAAVIANLDFIVASLKADGDGARGAVPAAPNEASLREAIGGPLADAREAAHRMRFLVRDLKVFSRSQADEPTCPVDVEALMDSSLRMADNEIRHRAHIVRQYGPVPSVQASEARLGQVFLNLLVNAAQALPDGRADLNEIRVSSRLEGERVIVEVSDTGTGIPPEIVGRIFDAFFTTKEVGGGTGLGLAISQRIITDMGGELTVESTMGKGTTFRVALPVAPMQENETAPPVEPAASVNLRGRILLVDDEEMLLRILTLILSDDHDVVATESARAALALCAGGERFDVILCDLMMPEMTGMDLYRELARLDPAQASRMIFLTGGAFTPNAQRFLSDNAREYIEKPFDTVKLRATVQRHLRTNS
jgi:PAS domain S-box-containing protein